MELQSLEGMSKAALAIRLLHTCEKICNYFSCLDFEKANKNKQGKWYKKRRSYSLSSEALEAHEFVKMCHAACVGKLNKEMEEEIKTYVLKIRRLYPQTL